MSSLSQISPDAAIRDASVAAEKQYEEFSIEQTMRHDLYVVIQGLIDKTDLKTLDHEEARMLSKMERSFRRNGLHLPEEKRNEFKELRKRLSEVGIEYMKNWSNESSSKCRGKMYSGCIPFTYHPIFIFQLSNSPRYRIKIIQISWIASKSRYRKNSKAWMTTFWVRSNLDIEAIL